MGYVFCAFQEHKLCNVDLKNAEAVERLGMGVSAGAMKNARAPVLKVLRMFCAGAPILSLLQRANGERG